MEHRPLSVVAHFSQYHQDLVGTEPGLGWPSVLQGLEPSLVG